MVSRKQILFGINDADDKNFLSLMCDRADRAIASGRRIYSRFLSPREQLYVTERFSTDVEVIANGGYDGAERRIVCFSPFDTYETEFDFRIVPLVIRTKNRAVLSHRDYLGSVLSLGIKRELVGDIVICDDCAVVFCHSEISDYIMFNLTRIANLTVTVDEADASGLTLPERRFEERSLTVSSMRLDCVLSAAANKSRTVSAELIERGMVCVNYDEVKNASRTVMDGDVISVRGIGKMLIHTDMSLTKKGKYHIEVSKYV